MGPDGVGVVSTPRRFDVFLVSLDPTQGHEIQKTRPCAVVSPDSLNRPLQTVTVAPMTSGGRAYPFRVACLFAGTNGQIALDQMRTVDRSRLVRHLGRLDDETADVVLDRLQAMFAR